MECDIESPPTKLDLILQELQEIKNQINDLKKDSQPTKSENILSVGEDLDPEQNTSMKLLQCSRSMEDIEGIGFWYDEENHQVKCTVCVNDNNQNKSDKPASTGVFKNRSSDWINFTIK